MGADFNLPAELGKTSRRTDDPSMVDQQDET